MKMKAYLSVLLTFCLILALFAGCGASPAPETTPTEVTTAPTEAVTEPSIETEAPETLPRLMVMSGPTGVGAARLMAESETTDAPVVASAEVVTDNEAVKNALINGDADIAAIATNMAATLYNKTGGGIRVLAINTLGVLYLLEKGDSLQSLADLKGKTLYATGQGANPEYILNYLLNSNGISPQDVDIQWMTAQEVIARMATEEAGICMLPVPAATTLMMKDSTVRQAISLSEEWDRLGQGALAQGCIVVRAAYLEENPQSVANFLAAYASSIAYMNEEANREEAAGLVAQYEITANAQIAAKAIPQCNLVCLTGQEMKDTLISFFDVMYQANPASIGGAMPEDAFYYEAG